VQMSDNTILISAARVAETNDLDCKSELPPAKGLPQTDFPKDVAAMANSGGGVIVFGVREEQKAATVRVDVGELAAALLIAAYRIVAVESVRRRLDGGDLVDVAETHRQHLDSAIDALSTGLAG